MGYCGWMRNIHNLWVNTVKHLSDHRKHKYELVDKPVRQPSKIFTGKEIATKIIMDCRAAAQHQFRKRLGFKQYDQRMYVNQRAINADKNR